MKFVSAVLAVLMLASPVVRAQGPEGETHARHERGRRGRRLRIVTKDLPDVIVNNAYDQQLFAVGGVAPYTWSIVSGSVPDGITLTTDGALFGTPTVSGSFSFVVQVVDSNNRVSQVIIEGTNEI